MRAPKGNECGLIAQCTDGVAVVPLTEAAALVSVRL
jgi:hypothetical protein